MRKLMGLFYSYSNGFFPDDALQLSTITFNFGALSYRVGRWARILYRGGGL